MVSKIGAIFVFIGSLMAFANAVSQPLPAVSQPVPSFACTMQFDPLCYYHIEKQCFADAGNECSFNGMVARDGLDSKLCLVQKIFIKKI